MRTLLLLFAFAVSVSWPIQSTPAAEPLLNGGDFEQGTIGQAPAGWRTFTPGTSPAVTVTAGGPAPSEKCLVGRSSPSGKLVALTKSFSSLQQRVQIEFSFAFSETKGRAFHIWTSEPDATDAGRLNLCVQNGELMQFDGRTRTWDTVTRNIEPSTDVSRPVWHRLRAIVDTSSGGITFRVSEPGTLLLPEQPTATRHGYRKTESIGVIGLVSGQRIANDAWYLVDDLSVHGGLDLPAPEKVDPLPNQYELWTGPPIPADVTQIPFVPGIEHRTIHRPEADGYRFLHGAFITRACFTPTGPTVRPTKTDLTKHCRVNDRPMAALPGLRWK